MNTVVSNLTLESSEKIATLQESCLQMANSASRSCAKKEDGGMEQWAKDFKVVETKALSCDWYHGTWQYLRLVNMVAVPDWYPFYVDAIVEVLMEKPNAKVFISACADYGMLAKLHEAMDAYYYRTGNYCKPDITIADICITPLQNAQWYASVAHLKIGSYVVDNIIEGDFPKGEYDLIITDEFLSVIKDDLKQNVVDRWQQLLKPDGCLITTAMQGEPTTPEKREFYANKAAELIRANTHLFPFSLGPKDFDKIIQQTNRFASLHTRHMIRDRDQLAGLFRSFDHLQLDIVETPGECVNPTFSYQIVARLAK